MNEMRGSRVVASCLLAAGVLFAPTSALPFGQPTHQRIVEAAVDAMVDADAAPPPAGISAADWKAYTERLKASRDRLRNLRTGLDGARAGIHNDPGVCGYRDSDVPGRDLNLLNAANIRISEFRYYPNQLREPCAFDRLAESWDKRDRALGPTLGWHAQNIDERVDDTVLWVRPTSAGVLGLQKELANRVIEFGLGAAIVPFVCLAQLIFSDDGCDADDAFDLATKLNPIPYVDGLIPGVGPIKSPDFVGVWHFIDTGAATNRYNDVRGMFYEQAGPAYPSAIDVAIMAGADIAGLSLNAFASEGPERYGRFDRVDRAVTQWQAHTLGHIEFSPVDNLARHGWDAYVADPTTARPLSWPLHAIGDAAAPHHVTGTTGWGHRPFEDAVDDQRDALLPPLGNASFASFRDRVLRIGFDASRAFQGNPSIQAFIEREAYATRDLARGDGDWVFQDGLSIEWHAGAEAASEKIYEDQLPRIRSFVEHAVGHTIALLARAGDLAQDLGFDPQTLCPIGGYYTGKGNGCADGLPPQPPAVIPLPPGINPVLVPACQAYGQTCSANAQCCDNVPCIGGIDGQPGRCRYP